MRTPEQQDGPARPISRRRFHGFVMAGMAAVASGCATVFRRPSTYTAPSGECQTEVKDDAPFEYIVVGSGAGGGPLAANLARAGYRVLLLEAGGDDEPLVYQVPVFHAYASEDPALSWNFFVRHYADTKRQKRDRKFDYEHDGVLYPRAGTLGGCTAHNAMITIYPHASDFDAIAEYWQDPSWRSDDMRRYFERLERCTYNERPMFGPDESRHGYEGWLTTTTANPKLILGDAVIIKLFKAVVGRTLHDLGGLFTRVLNHVRTRFDPNDWRFVTRTAERVGFVLVPLAVNGGRRNGPREYIRAVEKACPKNLVVRTHALATRVLLDDDQRAVGVEYLEGAHLYRADPAAEPRGQTGVLRTVTASREVILAGGAFNSPQLLKLSGIGPRAELERHGIRVRVDLPGVGERLQDRYEVGVVTEMKEDFNLLREGLFRPPVEGESDPTLEQWRRGEGVYTTNGAVAAVIRESTRAGADPDLFIFGLAGYFRGYQVGYSKEVEARKRFFTWAILKAHTKNTAGRVLLRSADPRDVPHVNFHYFDEGTDKKQEHDLEAVVDGIEHARSINAKLSEFIAREVEPGADINDREKLKEWVKNEAWGHHASCSNKMGRREDGGVVDNDFRVHGTKGLRVVDASVFPAIPGFFIVTSVYMISEKASDVILVTARTQEV